MLHELIIVFLTGYVLICYLVALLKPMFGQFSYQLDPFSSFLKNSWDVIQSSWSVAFVGALLLLRIDRFWTSPDMILDGGTLSRWGVVLALGQRVTLLFPCCLLFPFSFRGL